MSAPPPSYNTATAPYPPAQPPPGYEPSLQPPPPVYATPQSGAPAYRPPQQAQGYGQPPPGGFAVPPPQQQQPPHNDPAYPPTNPDPYFSNTSAMQPSVFSPDFNAQYMADYSKPAEGGAMSGGFIPPNAVPPNEVTEVHTCVCLPDQSDMGTCYMIRIMFSIIGHLLFFGSLLAVIIMAVLGDSLPIYIYGLLGVGYVMLLTESCCAHDFSYLREIKDAGEFRTFMTNLHGAKPSLTLHVECYHYETRHYTEHYTDSKGNRRSRRKTKRVKVVSHRETEPFHFNGYRDLAPPNINVEGKKATRIMFFRTYQFGDENTRGAFESQSMNIRNRNRSRDVHMSYYENFTLPGFTERMLAFMDPNARHVCFNPYLFILASFFLCTWPFRWWFRRVTAKTSYTFVKQLTV